MAKAYPKEFRDDVVAVARHGQAPLSQIAKDFGISEGSLTNWMRKADIEDGHRPGLTDADRVELRELENRNRLLEQENEVLRRCGVSVAGESAGKIVFPHVREMAATGAPIRVPVAVACRVLGLSNPGVLQVAQRPGPPTGVGRRHLIDAPYELHGGDETLGYRFFANVLEDEHGIVVGENRVHWLCRIAGITAAHKKRSKAGSTGPAPHDDLLAVVDEHGVVRHEFLADGPNKVWL